MGLTHARPNYLSLAKINYNYDMAINFMHMVKIFPSGIFLFTTGSSNPPPPESVASQAVSTTSGNVNMFNAYNLLYIHGK